MSENHQDINSGDDSSLVKKKEDSAWLSLANLLFRRCNPVDKTILLKRNEAFIFLIIIVTAPSLTFSMMLYYFLVSGCQPASLTFSGVPNAKAVVQSVANSEVYRLCATIGIRAHHTFCCSLDGVNYLTSDPICDTFQKGMSHCDNQVEVFPCYNSNSTTFQLVELSVMQCASPPSALINSMQYALFVSVIVTGCFVIIKLVISKGLFQLFSRNAWKEFLKDESAV